MSIEIKVVNFKGTPAANTQRLIIDELGAKIGRSPSCALCLEDPGRTISREQFEILCRGQNYFLVDKGSNPTQINGRPLGQGASVEVKPGDKVSIGDYELEITVNTPTNPLEGIDLFGSSSTPKAKFDGGSSTHTGELSNSNKQDLEDWDFLSPNSSSYHSSGTFKRSAHSQPTASDPLGLGDDQFYELPSNQNELGIDDLLGLGQVNDNTQSSSDYGKSPVFNPAKSDDFDDLFGDLETLTKSTSADPFEFAERALPVVNEPMPTLRKASVAQELPKPIPAFEEKNSHQNGIQHEIWSAFERGLGFSLGTGVTPKQAEQCGVVLRHCLEGTQKLLKARAVFKQELRAEMTVIMAKENNPLKLSPNIDGALSLMLAENSNGYKAAGPATLETFEDLLSHQTGMVAGLKAAMDALLAQFKPDQLEAQFSKKSLLTNILPGARKAKSWEVFCDTYENISQEAADNFQKAFGEAFLKAYEQQMAELYNSRSR